MEFDAVIEENLVTFDLIFSELKSVNGHSIGEVKLEGEYNPAAGAKNTYLVKRDDGVVLGKIYVQNYAITAEELEVLIKDYKKVWDEKYDKPAGGIPKSDLSAEVQRSISKADTALQEHQSLADYAKKSDLSTVYRVMGSCYRLQLPTDPKVGDVWNILDEYDGVVGQNLVWTSEGWDKLGGTINLEAYATVDEVNDALKDVYEEIENATPDDYDAVKTQVGANATDISSLTTRVQTLEDEPSVPEGVVTVSDSTPSDTVKKTWLKDGEELVAPFTTLDCVVDSEGTPVFQKVSDLEANTYTKTETDTLLVEKANATSVSDYLGIDITKKRNIWDEEWENGNISASNGLNSEDGSTNAIRSVGYISVKPNTAYYMVDPTGHQLKLRYYASDKTFIGHSDKNGVTGGGERTTHANCGFIRFSVDNLGTYNHDIAIIEGTTGVYVPYVPTLREGTIVASGGNDTTGYYVRFANGVQMCWKRTSRANMAFSAWGSIFTTTSNVVVGNFPMPFIDVPVTSCKVVDMGGSLSLMPVYSPSSSTTQWGQVSASRGTTASDIAVVAEAFAIGRWK